MLSFAGLLIERLVNNFLGNSIIVEVRLIPTLEGQIRQQSHRLPGGWAGFDACVREVA